MTDRSPEEALEDQARATADAPLEPIPSAQGLPEDVRDGQVIDTEEPPADVRPGNVLTDEEASPMATDQPPPQSGVVGALTDGTGVSSITPAKFIKDFVADVLLSGAAALAAVQITDVGAAIDQQQVVAFALVGAVVRAGYRAALRWATSN